MKLLELTPNVRDIPKEIADSFIRIVNSELDRRIGLHKDCFTAFWHSTEATPQEICDRLGDKAALYFQLGAENINHIQRALSIVGKNLDDYIASELYTPPCQVTFNEDGTVRLS